MIRTIGPRWWAVVAHCGVSTVVRPVGLAVQPYESQDHSVIRFPTVWVTVCASRSSSGLRRSSSKRSHPMWKSKRRKSLLVKMVMDRSLYKAFG